MAQTSKRGFASMDPQKQREIASKGGKAAHLKGTAHEFTPEEAREAGRKGGTSVSRDRSHMALIGREGGQARGERAQKRQSEGQQNLGRVDTIDKVPGAVGQQFEPSLMPEKEASSQ